MSEQFGSQLNVFNILEAKDWLKVETVMPPSLGHHRCSPDSGTESEIHAPSEAASKLERGNYLGNLEPILLSPQGGKI